MAEAWYYRMDGQTIGPVTRDHMMAIAKSGEIAPTTLVWHEGMSEWAQAKTIRFSAAPKTPPPPPASEPPVASPKPAPKSTQPVTASARRSRPKSGNEILIGAAICIGLFLIIGGFIVIAATKNPTDSNHASPQNRVAINTPTKTQPAPATPRESRPIETVEPAPHGSPADDGPLMISLDRQTTEPVIEPTPREPLEAEPVEPEPVEPVDEDPFGVNTNPAPTNTVPVSKVDTSEIPQPEPKPVEESKQSDEKPVELYQEIAVARQPSFVVQGLTMSQDIQYVILSKLQVSPIDKEGRRTVSQVVENTRLEKADALTRATFEKSLRELIGQQFSFVLNDRHDVIEFTGHKDTRESIEAKPKGFEGFMVTSVMDEDGWKEIAQLSFFKPDETATNGTWQRQMTHDWDALGSWYGQTTFRTGPRSGQADQYNYWHEMTYKPPAKGAGGLPFEISSAKFETQQAGGTIHFNSEIGRVVMAEEKFRTLGILETQVLGQPSRVQVDEQQLMIVRSHDQNPWQSR